MNKKKPSNKYLQEVNGIHAEVFGMKQTDDCNLLEIYQK